MKHIKTNKNHRKIHASLWILQIPKQIRGPKVSRLLPDVCDFQKENHTPGYGFKNLYKIYSLAYGF
jgi:hypothetical protein